MKDLRVKRLSEYSEKDLQNLQLILSVAYQAAKSAGNSTVMKEADGWGYVVREALEEKKFWGCREVENFLRITAPTRIRLIRTGRLIPKRIGRKAFYDREAVMAFFETYRKGAHSA